MLFQSVLFLLSLAVTNPRNVDSTAPQLYRNRCSPSAPLLKATIHGPALSIRSIEHLVDGLADAYDAGLCKAVGVSNFSADQVHRTHSTLLKRNIPLESNQSATLGEIVWPECGGRGAVRPECSAA